jgi:hypothetical protein
MANEFIARNGVISKGNVVVTGSLTTSGSLTATGTITATTLVVQTITSSISSITGSTNFGSLSSNTHTFTGSIITSGSVGIGTSSPGTTLDVVSPNGNVNTLTSTNATTVYTTYKYNTSTSVGYVGNGVGVASGGVAGDFGLQSVNNLLFATNGGTTRMYISASGNIGIGTTAPTTMLNLSSANPVITLTRSDNGTTGAGAINFCATSTVKWQIGTNQAVGNGLEFNAGDQTNNKMYLTTDGNLGVGLNPGVIRMRVQATANGEWIAAFTTTAATNPYGIYVDTSGATSTGYSFAAYTNTGTGFFIRNNGNVSLGTSSDVGRRLYVLGGGNTSASSCATFDNSTGFTLLQLRNDGNILANSTVFNNAASGTIRTLYLGNGDYYIGGISSIRASKKNIENVSDINWLYQLNPVTFNYRKQDENKNYTEEVYNELNYGLIAEDTQPIADFLINYNDKEDGTKEMIGIEYPRLITPMLKAIQEQQALITDLRTEIEELKARI